MMMPGIHGSNHTGAVDRVFFFFSFFFFFFFFFSFLSFFILFFFLHVYVSIYDNMSGNQHDLFSVRIQKVMISETENEMCSKLVTNGTVNLFLDATLFNFYLSIKYVVR